MNAKRTPLGVRDWPDQQLLEHALGGWHTLTPILQEMSSRQVAVLLSAEVYSAERREPIVKLLHRRLARMRTEREARWLAELLVRFPDGLPPSLRDAGLEWLLEEL